LEAILVGAVLQLASCRLAGAWAVCFYRATLS